MPTTDEGKQTILIVDDSMMNRSLLADMVGPNYNIIEAENGKQAVAELQKFGTSISLVLLDIVMPEMDGFEVLAVMNSNNLIREVPVIMVSSETESSYIERAYELGATDFISRPFDQNIVSRRVQNTIMLYAKQKALIGMVADQIYEREKANSLMVAILSHIVEFRNGESGLHVLHVSTMTELLLNQIARKTDKYNLTPADISRIAMASSLHDIGKISIPDSILNKPGRLTDEEFNLMKAHAAIGANMLDDVPVGKGDPLVLTARDICRWHHERYDGKGYPDGLVGEEIPISAQAVSLADVYDALTSKRVYKEAYSHEKAIEMISGGECGAFNPFLLECFLDIADDIQEQLRLNSLSRDSDKEIHKIVDSALEPVANDASSRTLKLLDYERMKYHFFASMSNELQFEYTSDTDVLVFSEWGSSNLGLPEVIEDPLHNEQLQKLIGSSTPQAISSALRRTTYDNPVTRFEFQALVEGEPRWYQITARAIWDAEDPTAFYGAIGKVVDVHENHERIVTLEHDASHDSLTGLYNHAFAKKEIQDRMEKRPDNCFVFIVLDMDHFKDINDTYGHLTGDRVLHHLAKRLEGSVRGNDIVARVGGDEFFVCMECIDPEPLVERIYNTVTGVYDGHDISVSMGIAFALGKERTYDELFRSADNALYEMKRAGRGGYVFCDNQAAQDDAHTALSSIDGSESSDAGLAERP